MTPCQAASFIPLITARCLGPQGAGLLDAGMETDS